MNRPDHEAKQPRHARNPSGAELSRRAFVRLGAVGAAFGSLPLWSPVTTARAAESPAAPAEVRPPLPVVDARFPCRIADGIWLIPDKRIFLVPNIGIVEGSRSVLVIDSGLTPDSGRGVLEAARAIAGKRDLILTVTHAHPEHTFGAQAFKGEARIYYNQLQRDYLARAGQNILERFRRVTLQPDRAYLLDEVRITPADDVYAGDRATLDLGGRTVEFRTWGTAHSPGDQVIVVPDQGVTFAGDLIEERMFPIADSV
jgi:glyoxylase-like metal-dependent hydrolase (beta-lactamase superfamily II)